MKSIIKVCNMETKEDARIIQENIANNDGVVASEISLLRKEITVIYNEYFLTSENIIDCIEDLGYIVI